jgi:hypothetical protein
VTVLDQKVEVTTYRWERYTADSRKPEVEFSTNIVDDLERRDFTVNSLALRVDTGVPDLLDPFQGEKDIKDKVLRTNLPPDVVFSEDPLRMVRAVRFQATKGYKIAVSVRDSIRRNAIRLDIVAVERIMDEVRKINKEGAAGISHAWYTALDLHIEDYIFGKLEFKSDDALATLVCMCADAPTTWAMMLIDSRVDHSRGDHVYLLSDLKLSNAEIREIDRIACAASEMPWVESWVAAGTLVRDVSTEDFVRAWQIVFALWGGMPALAQDLLLEARTLSDKLKAPMPVDGHDVMTVRDIEPSGSIGFVLRQVEVEFLYNPDLTREQALDIIRAAPLERRSVTS